MRSACAYKLREGEEEESWKGDGAHTETRGCKGEDLGALPRRPHSYPTCSSSCI